MSPEPGYTQRYIITNVLLVYNYTDELTVHIYNTLLIQKNQLKPLYVYTTALHYTRLKPNCRMYACACAVLEWW